MKLAITNEVRKVDDVLFEHLGKFRPKDFLIPINREEERAIFFQALQNKKTYNPVFKYKQNDELLLRIKTAIQDLQLPDHPLSKIYQEVIQEKINYIDFIQTRNADSFRELSSVFGPPSQYLVEEAFGILKRYKANVNTGVYFGIKLLSDKIRSRLAVNNIEGWGIAETHENVWIAEVNHTTKKILLEEGIIVNQEIFNHLVKRCIEVSIFRSKNAERQPLRIFELGLTRSDETELGLALETSIDFGGFHSKFLIHAARSVIASHYAQSHSFFETFQLLNKILPEDISYDLSERVKMGLVDTSQGGGIMLEHLALQGRKKIQTMGNEDLYYLYTGNVSYHHLPLIHDLIAQNILFEPAFIPHFLYEK